MSESCHVDLKKSLSHFQSCFLPIILVNKSLLVSKLTYLYQILNSSKVRIFSFFRCYFHLLRNFRYSFHKGNLDCQISKGGIKIQANWFRKQQQNLWKGFLTYTANIFEVFFTVFNCVPISTVISLYGLHFIAAPSTV